jgi:predicted dehydrogenase
VKRRELLQTATALGALMTPKFGLSAAPPVRRTVGPSDRIRVGFIGVGNFGTVNLRDFQANPDVEVAALCDVFQTHLDKAQAAAGGKAKTFRDYRRLLEDPAIDAVVISTPEHWHALMAIEACDAGKDVYVEKPASTFATAA